jgi:hypothetical protein
MYADTATMVLRDICYALGFSFVLAAIVGTVIWYASGPEPPKPPVRPFAKSGEWIQLPHLGPFWIELSSERPYDWETDGE